MLAVRLPDDTEQRLEALAHRTGRAKAFYVREAIEAHLDELEDFYLVEERLRSFRDRDVDVEIDGADRGALIDVLRQLWTQGEASGAAVEGNFDPHEIALRGERRLTAIRRGD
jgi:RHH-type rel operon transcriptional repressor/antitoxin RelB